MSSVYKTQDSYVALNNTAISRHSEHQ